MEADPGVDTARGVRSSDAPAASHLSWVHVIGFAAPHGPRWRRCTRSSESSAASVLHSPPLSRPEVVNGVHMNGSLLQALPGARRSQVGALAESSAPCHALPGRVGIESRVVRGYDLAQFGIAVDDM